MKFEVFERLNTGGLDLNAQEIRNTIYSGILNNTLKVLEQNPDFRHCLGTVKPRKRMVDRELALRFLALSDQFDTYRPPLVRFLNEYMKENRNPDDAWLDERVERFNRTASTLREILGTSSFRVIDRAGTPIEKNINRALFDAQALVFSVAEPSSARAHRSEVISALGALFKDATFQDAIRRATGDRARTIERTRDVAKALADCGVSLRLSDLGKL